MAQVTVYLPDKLRDRWAEHQASCKEFNAPCPSLSRLVAVSLQDWLDEIAREEAEIAKENEEDEEWLNEE